MEHIPPVLLLAFNRPQATARVFAVLRKVKPSRLFIALDGPGKGRDEWKCKQVKEILKTVDWDCDVKRLYRTTHIGLEKGLSEAISWFFDQVESGIVLEDDCVPDPTFFTYCATMLSVYESDERVMAINGSSFLPLDLQDPNSYYISRYVHFWGWASWRRAWRRFEPTMKEWPTFKQSSYFHSLFKSYWEKIYFQMIFDSTYRGKTNSWGYRWLYSVWLNKGKAVSPGVNLVRNIGFTKEATHKVLRTFELPTRPISAVLHEASLGKAKCADRATARRYYGISPWMIMALKIFYTIKKK